MLMKICFAIFLVTERTHEKFLQIYSSAIFNRSQTFLNFPPTEGEATKSFDFGDVSATDHVDLKSKVNSKIGMECIGSVTRDLDLEQSMLKY